jgi:hypothetical protein
MSTHTKSTVRTRVAAGLTALAVLTLAAACGTDSGGSVTPQPAAHHARKVNLHHSPDVGVPPPVRDGTQAHGSEAHRRAVQHDSRFHGVR